MSALKMAWSKSTRIKVMIAIDVTFFLLELIVGFLVHSLALTADAFHMLNDIISLIIGLWAVVAAQKASTDEFTFGWVRAEILGAFFNAVFLIALCVSIILEAITRFVEPPEIDNPKLILIVGCAGLFSNLVGFVVLGGHGHSHGPGDGHDHDHGHDHSHSETNAAYDHSHSHDFSGNIHDQLHDHARAHGHVHDEEEAISSKPAADDEPPRRIRFGNDGSSKDDSDAKTSRTSVHSRGRHSRRPSKNERARLTSIGDMSIHPASFRQDIIAASMAAASPTPEGGSSSSSNSSDTEAEACQPGDQDANEESPLLSKGQEEEHGHGTLNNNNGGTNGASHCKTTTRPRRDSSVHAGHNHTLPRKPGKSGGHSHGDMGMNAMVLHVIGDALGNIGVIVTALIIWLTDLPGKYYADPAVSLAITAIILKTAIPLTRATSKVLLQATPEHISIAEIREDIEALPGVVTCHHIHIWQLSDTKVVASMHLEVSFPLDSNSGHTYMQLAKRTRKCLHGFGIHSATIQPEFFLGHQRPGTDPSTAAGSSLGADADTVVDDTAREVCLLECVDECDAPGCCSSSVEENHSRSATPRPSGSSQT